MFDAVFINKPSLAQITSQNKHNLRPSLYKLYRVLDETIIFIFASFAYIARQLKYLPIHHINRFAAVITTLNISQ
jgi:hypothetical protein